MAHADQPQFPPEATCSMQNLARPSYSKTDNLFVGRKRMTARLYLCHARSTASCAQRDVPVSGNLKHNVWSNRQHYQFFYRNVQDCYFQPWMFDAENVRVPHLHNKTCKTLLFFFFKGEKTILIRVPVYSHFFILQWNSYFKLPLNFKSFVL